tara:strand:- start:399 stop:593 length:195 start_codon:yes stop_codon:yes gene_type:complete
MNESGTYLSDEQQAQLRVLGLLTNSEVAMKKGDIVVAVSALTNESRIIGNAKDVLSENKRILKG